MFLTAVLYIMKTFYLGPDGSFSGLALNRAIELMNVSESERIDAGENSNIIPLLRDNHGSLAVAAMHTDAEGRVEDLFRSLMRLLDTGAQISIGAALVTPIQFTLMGRRGINLGNAKGVVAHKKGLGACPRMVEALLNSEEVTSNSRAALLVATEERFGDWLALASLGCAEKFGLEVIAENVSNEPAVTTFYVFGNGLKLPKLKSGCWRLLSFVDLLDVPGSLHELTGAVKEHNSLYIHSIHKDAKNYRFVIEIEFGDEETALVAAEKISRATLKAMSFAFPVLS
ncbi:MAG: prephenate dehydratase [Candidatus Taylorbacteria bacterium]|nr:prephenate dehydratase [Candidatus Taylorbacteria bacterium]